MLEAMDFVNGNGTQLLGSDIFTTKRYAKQGRVVCGRGASAKVTADGDSMTLLAAYLGAPS